MHAPPQSFVGQLDSCSWHFGVIAFSWIEAAVAAGPIILTVAIAPDFVSA